MIITISGTPGSGKSTVAKLLAKRLKLKRYYMGQIWRDIAKKNRMTIREGLESSENDPKIDNEVDEYQKKLGKEEDNFIIEGRTSYFFMPNSLKIFLKTDLGVGAERIFRDLKDNKARNEGKFNSAEEVRLDLKKRMASDKKRYMKFYFSKKAKHILNGITSDIIIDVRGGVYNFGKYNVTINTKTKLIRVYSCTPHKYADKGSHIHPHVSSGNECCFGNLEGRVSSAMRMYKFGIVFDFIHSLLCSYFSLIF